MDTTVTNAAFADSVNPRLLDRNTFPPEMFFDRRWLFQCNIKILIVTDWSGGFDETTNFHLGQIIKLLGDDPWSHVSFEITKAHRQSSPDPEAIDGFRFDAHDLEQYSQIWMFGVHREGDGAPVSASELQAISIFMDGGGGVLAMGDHEDLGNSMCAQVPRVRSMRRWYYPDAGPNGEPVAPIQTQNPALPQFLQHDTQVGGGSQTDPFPQEIRPRMYSLTLGGGIIRRQISYPHPLLCGPTGVINYLPDHMHEGLVEVPADLSRNWAFNGQTFVEYPEKNGHQQVPEVIAWADNVVNSSEFGVIGAYDGHRVDVGRVVVDATWHHWFNINMWPYINASDPAHPTYTPATVAQWEEMKAYFHNVGVWLARPSLQTCIRNNGLIRVLGDADISITVRDLHRVPDHLVYFWQIGRFAKDALGRFANQCQSVRWIIDLIFPERIPPWRIDPWIIDPRISKIPEVPWLIDFEELETVWLGAAIHGAHAEFGSTDQPKRLMEDDGKKVFAAMTRSAQQGLEAIIGHREKGIRDSRKFFKSLAR